LKAEKAAKAAEAVPIIPEVAEVPEAVPEAVPEVPEAVPVAEVVTKAIEEDSVTLDMLNRLIDELNKIKATKNGSKQKEKIQVSTSKIDELVNYYESQDEKLRMIINLLSKDYTKEIQVYLLEKFVKIIKAYLINIKTLDDLQSFRVFFNSTLRIEKEEIQNIIIWNILCILNEF
jgi:hypothetical protein